MAKKVMKKEMCCPEGHMHIHGWKMLIVGLLILANTYWPFLSWPAFIGALIALLGIKKLIMCCK